MTLTTREPRILPLYRNCSSKYKVSKKKKISSLGYVKKMWKRALFKRRTQHYRINLSDGFDGQLS